MHHAGSYKHGQNGPANVQCSANGPLQVVCAAEPASGLTDIQTDRQTDRQTQGVCSGAGTKQDPHQLRNGQGIP